MRHGSFDGLRVCYRHACTFFTDVNSFPLSAKGADEVRRASAELPNRNTVGVILTSPHRRARESAEVLQKELQRLTGRHVPVETTELLSEVRYDISAIGLVKFYWLLLNGGKDAVASYGFRLWQMGECGETPVEVLARVFKLLRHLAWLHERGVRDVVCVSHGSFGRAVKRVLDGQETITMPREVMPVLRPAGWFALG